MFLLNAIIILLTWNIVLTFLVRSNVTLLFRAARWTLTIYLFIMAFLIQGILRAGLSSGKKATATNQPSIWLVMGCWCLWFLIIGFTIRDWRFTIFAVAMPLAALLYFPELSKILDRGFAETGLVNSLCYKKGASLGLGAMMANCAVLGKRAALSAGRTAKIPIYVAIDMASNGLSTVKGWF